MNLYGLEPIMEKVKAMHEALDAEPLTVGRIDVQEFRDACAQGHDIFAERVEKHIREILQKYNCALVVKSFNWTQGKITGEITVTRLDK
jgi:hypothetical protein